MKKGFLVFLIAICFASLSFGLVRIKPKVSRETRIANLREYVIKYNGVQKHRDMIHPGDVYYFPTVQMDYEKDTYSDPHFSIDTHHGDSFSKMSAAYLYGVAIPSLPMNQSVVDKVPVPASEPAVPGVESSDSGWLWFLLVVAFVFLLLAGYFAFINEKLKTEKEEIAKANERARKELERELEATKNKLPIIAPPLATTNWLRNNNPVGDDITSYPENASSAIERVYGKKPDLVAQALVSTAQNATNMGFSHDRKAITGLTDVKVYLGWNWGTKKSEWTEVGMIASICSNGFQVSPEKVVPMSQLFTKFELADDAFPIAFMDDKVPLEANYPELLASLVIKYHEKPISDLKRSGVKVGMPKTKKEKK